MPRAARVRPLRPAPAPRLTNCATMPRAIEARSAEGAATSQSYADAMIELATRAMSDGFAEWPGWTPVSAIAQVLSLVTLVAALARYISNRRQMPLVQLTCQVLGDTSRGNDRYHVVELTNAGRGAAHLRLLQFFEARIELEDSFRPPSVLASGASCHLLLTAPELSKVWYRSITGTTDDARRATVQWLPLIDDSDLGEQWDGAVSRYKDRSILQRLRDRRRPPVVAPGEAFKATFRVRGQDHAGQFTAVLGNPPSSIQSVATTGLGHAADLPFVPKGDKPRRP